MPRSAHISWAGFTLKKLRPGFFTVVVPVATAPGCAEVPPAPSEPPSWVLQEGVAAPAPPGVAAAALPPAAAGLGAAGLKKLCGGRAQVTRCRSEEDMPPRACFQGLRSDLRATLGLTAAQHAGAASRPSAPAPQASMPPCSMPPYRKLGGGLLKLLLVGQPRLLQLLLGLQRRERGASKHGSGTWKL